MNALRSLALVIVASGTASSWAQAPSDYSCRFARVPVRDGIHLNTSICEPRGAHGPLPFLLTRTPYGIAGDTTVRQDYRFFARDGYIFVFQDIRGRYGSEGQFIMQRPPRASSDTAGVDESTDTYDTVTWLLKNVPANNGRVGVLGVSYPGFLATMAGVNPHPAVKAISPQAPMTDTWMGDDFFHQGAFRLSYGFEYAGSMELSSDSPLSGELPIDTWDTYEWYYRVGPLANVDTKYFRGKVPTWKAFENHPSYDSFWQTRAVQRRLRAPLVPT
ncbi:MAG TPA: CocE/NonD family hydrolase, partial [Gemmatimonadales bacterium]|nr:CocE/NonD family hydrolase [Gemmatimonadales bacterium]